MGEGQRFALVRESVRKTGRLALAALLPLAFSPLCGTSAFAASNTALNVSTQASSVVEDGMTGTTEDGFQYIVYNGYEYAADFIIYITGVTEKANTSRLTIPAEIKGCPVTVIDSDADFSSLDKVQEISFPACMEEVGTHSLPPNIKSMRFASGSTTLGFAGFSDVLPYETDVTFTAPPNGAVEYACKNLIDTPCTFVPEGSAVRATEAKVCDPGNRITWVKDDNGDYSYRAAFTAHQYLCYTACNTSLTEGLFTVKNAAGQTLVSHTAEDFIETPFALAKGETVAIEVKGDSAFRGGQLPLYVSIQGIPSDSTDYGNFKGSWSTSSKARISTIAPKVTDATYDMLSNYISKGHMDIATTLRSTPTDAEVLKKLSDQIVAKGGSDTQKATRMALWVAHNVEYNLVSSGTAIDTFYTRAASCEGVAALTVELMRLAGIPAVFTAGYNAANLGGLSKITFAEADSSQSTNHAWVYAYTDGKWRMYDPLFGVYASTDKAAQSKNYCPWDVEAITPTYEGEDLSIAGYEGTGFFLINQRVFDFNRGKPGFEDGSPVSRIMHDYDGTAMFGLPLLPNSGTSYWKGDTQQANKEYDNQYLAELLKGGPISDGNVAFARNSAGICYAGSFPIDAASGERLFIAYNCETMRFIGDVNTVQLSSGRPVIEVNKKARLLLPPEYGDSRYRVTFSVFEGGPVANYTTVEEDGTVKCTREGNVWINYEVYSAEDGEYIGGGDIQYIALKNPSRKADYSDDRSKWVRDPTVPGIPETSASRLKKGASITNGSLKYTVLSDRKSVSVKVKSSSAAKSLKSVSIPAAVEDKNGFSYSVTTISSDGFKGCSKLTTVNCTGASKLTSIGSKAFSGCSSLASVSITSPCLSTIGSYAFYKTKSLTSVFIGKTTKLKSVSNAFANGGKKSGKSLSIKVKSSKASAYKKLILAEGGNKKLSVKKA